MNLIAFEVTEVLSKPVKHITSSGVYYWLTAVIYSDDGGDGQRKTVMSFSEVSANNIKPGWIGQH